MVVQVGGDFRPNRLEVPPDLAPDFEIDGIRVGEKDQFPVPGCAGKGMSAILFASDAFGVRWNDGGMTIAPAGTDIAVSVRNISKKQKTFKCSVSGSLVKDIEDEERERREREEEMSQEAAKPLGESRLAELDSRVMMLQERVNISQLRDIILNQVGFRKLFTQLKP